MSEYTVTDSKTGREITFEWNDTKPPTQNDMLSVFAEANKQTAKNPDTDKKFVSTEEPTPEWAGKHPNLYGLYGAGKELYKTVGKPAIETAGMIGGGIVGAGSGFLAGAGMGAIPGGAVGAGLGYAGARNLTGEIDKQLGINRWEDSTFPKVVKATGKDLLLGGVGGGPISPVNRAVLGNRHIGAQVSRDVLGKTGITLTPAESTGGKTLAQVESLLDQVPFSSDVIQTWREDKQLRPLLALRDRYLQAGVEGTPRGEQLGQEIKTVIEKKIKQFDASKTSTVNGLRDATISKLGSKESYETLSKGAQETISEKSAQAVAKKNALYSAVDDVMPQGELPFTNYQQEAQRHLDEISGLPNADKELKNILHWGTNVKQNPEEVAFLKSIEQYPPQVQEKLMAEAGISKVTEVEKTWKTMQNHRNQLTDIINGANKPTTNPMLHGQMDDVQRRAKLLRDALDSDFEQIAQKQGGEVLERYKIAQAFYADEYAPIWKNKIIRSMAHKNPDQVIDVAIKKGSTTEVNLIRKTIGDSEFNKTIKPAFTNKILGAGRDEAFNPEKFKKALNDYGEETLSKIYSKSELNTLRGIAETGQLILDQELPNASLLKSIASNTPNTIVSSIMGAVEKSPNSTSVLRNVTSLNEYLSPKQKEGLKLELMERVFRMNPITEQVEAGTLSKNIQKYRPTLEKFYSKEELKGLDSIAVIGRVMSKAQQMAANPSGTAKNVIAFGASNEIIFKPLETAMHGKILDAAGQVAVASISKVLGAKKLAELYLNPKTRQLLMKGMVTPRTTKEGIDIAKKLSIVLGNEYLSDQGEI